MRKIDFIILSACLLLTGCRSSDTGASSESHYDRLSRQIEQLKAQTAVSGTNIRIVVNMLTTRLDDYAAVDSLWQYADRNAAVAGQGGAFARSGLKIGLANENFRARLDIVKRSLKYSEDSELFLVVADGTSGYINIGTEIAVPRFFYSGRWYSGVEYEFRQAGKSLRVDARRLPDGRVEMLLTPVFSRFLSGGGDIELTELSTIVTARPGQAVVIGGSTTDNDNVAAALFSQRSQAEKRQTLITVTPYIR